MNVGVYQQLQEYEQKVFGSTDISNPGLPVFPPVATPPLFSFGFPKINDTAPVPAFNSAGATSIFSHSPSSIPPHEFTFGASPTQKDISGNPITASPPPNSNASDFQME